MNSKISWQLIVLVAILLAGVIISQAVTDGSEETILLIVTAVLSGTLGPAVSARSTDAKIAAVQQSADKAVAQTNGVLDDRIRDGVASVLTEHGVIPADADDPPTGKHTAG